MSARAARPLTDNPYCTCGHGKYVHLIGIGLSGECKHHTPLRTPGGGISTVQCTCRLFRQAKAGAA